MQIIVDYKEQKNDCNYYNNILEAIEKCVKSIGIKKLESKL